MGMLHNVAEVLENYCFCECSEICIVCIMDYLVMCMCDLNEHDIWYIGGL